MAGSFLFFEANKANAETYYVDNSCVSNGDGLTQNCGESEGTGPFNSISNMQLKESGYSPGDRILLKKNQTFREILTVPSSGTSENPITFGSYGTGDNPIINRSEPVNNWWRWSLFLNGSMEKYTVGASDVSDSITAWSTTSNGTGTTVNTKVEMSTVYQGLTSARLLNDQDGTPYSSSHYSSLGQSITVSPETTYYFDFAGRISDAKNNAIYVRVKDATNNVNLQPDLVTWGTVSYAIKFDGTEDVDKWIRKSASFTTPEGCTSIYVIFYNWANTSSYIDDFYFNTGTGRKDEKIWLAYTSDHQNHYGASKNGERIPYVGGSQSYYSVSLNDGETDYINGGNYFPYRLDSVSDSKDSPSDGPGLMDLGSRLDAIVVEDKNNIIIDGIDVKGQAGDIGTVPERGHYLINIKGTSENITVKNLSLSETKSVGILALDTTNNITYDNLTAYNCGDTGIYLETSGTIKNCTVYDVGLLYTDMGDKGGIGVQLGDVVVENNEVYNIGRIDTNTDFGISFWEPGQVTVRYNYVHDIYSGAIQIYSGGSGSVIAYNILEDYGKSEYSGSTSGKFSGIRISGTEGDSFRGAINLYNNIFTGGRWAKGNDQPALYISDPGYDGTVVKNNIFFNNSGEDVIISSTADTESVVFSNNNYYRNNYSSFYKWKGASYDSLIDVRNGIAGQESDSLSANPLFTNSSNGDFSLLSTSPAINAGTDVGLTLDYAGNTVPSGPAPDIGIYEFQDSTAPATTASVNSGTYSSTQSVTLTCNDNSGMGCDKTYYTTDGSDPTTGSSQYSSPISISSTTTLKFFSTDLNGNSESIKTRIYTISTSIEKAEIKVSGESDDFEDKITVKKNKITLKQSDSSLANGVIKIYKKGKLWKTISANYLGAWKKTLKLKDDFYGWIKIKFFNFDGEQIGSQKAKIRVDTEDPVFAYFPPENKIIYTAYQRDENRTLSFQATDNQRIKKYKIKFNGKTKTKKIAKKNQNKIQLYLVPKDTPQGTYVFEVAAYDEAGNKSEKEVDVVVR